MTITRRQIVLDVHMQLATITTFISPAMSVPHPSPNDPTVALTMDSSTWIAMDCPSKVTVSIEPGDTLPALETPGFRITAIESRDKELPLASRCPRCGSPSPERHPAMQYEGEVQPCPHDWHSTAGV